MPTLAAPRKTTFKNLRVVPQLIFGRGSMSQLADVLAVRRSASRAPTVFLIDDALANKPWVATLPVEGHDEAVHVNVDEEPKTKQIDALRDQIAESSIALPHTIVGIGGGSIMDIAKAVSLMLTNPGSSSEYQGWDLVKKPGVFKIGIPTLAGTGAEVSRTAVLTGPTKKLGLNSDFTPFDQIILDADLIADAPRDQRFFTAMDCYIHGAESLAGTFINEFARGFAEKSLDLCREVFLTEIDDALADEKLMVASYFGGMSIAYSQVGVCHALSYGLSWLLGVRHGIGNCIVFDQLEEYYGDAVREFRQMCKRHGIKLPRGITKSLNEEQMNRMIDVALGMEPLWQNALGPAWREHMTRERARQLYARM